MSILRIEKVVDLLPDPITADTLYMVKKGGAFELYVSDNAGLTAVPLTLKSDMELDPFLLMGVGND